jgi:predicted SpoU family rRNA methylase
MKISVSSLVFFIIGIALHIQTVIAKPDDTFINRLQSTESASSLFIENKGQICDQNGKPNPEVKYLILRPGLNIQLKKNSFSYDGYTIEKFKKKVSVQEPMHHEKGKYDDDSLVYHFHRVDIELLDANPNPQITHEGASSDYLNYYTHITAQTKGEEGVTGVRGYNKVSYHDIYPNIDLEWFLDKDGKPEYQFIINPGGDPSRIRLKYHGAQKMELVSDALHIHVKHGIIKEHIPLSYVQESQEKINVSFTKISENEYGFNVPVFAVNETLIIDPVPNRLWGTYYGGNEDDRGFADNGGNGIVNDQSGNVIFAAYTKSTTTIASAGAFQTVFGGLGWDAFVSKFNQSGNRSWTTYYGGSSDDVAFDVTVDQLGNVLLTGHTSSPTVMSTSGAYQQNLNGWTDTYIAKFNTSGARLWSTYYGGTSADDGLAIITDNSNNVIVVGQTQSTTSIASAGAHQATHAGNWDGYIVKFASNGSHNWSTYYGGTDLDKAFDVVIDQSGSIILVGSTFSSSSISTSGSYQPSYNNSGDGFITKFSSNGIRQWGTYYGGTSEDVINGISIDLDGNLVLVGGTTSTGSIASIGAFQQNHASNGSSRDAFVLKFSNSGSRIWSTYYGGTNDDVGYGIDIDQNNNIVISGTTASTTIATSGSHQAVYGGGTSDSFLTKFSSIGNREYCTFYGGSNAENNLDINVDSDGNIYLLGYTQSLSNISTASSYQQNYGGGTNDVFIVKFSSDNIALSSSTTIVSNVSCYDGNNGSATVTPIGGTSPYTYSWNSIPVQTTQTATGLKAGTYTVTVTDSKGSQTTSNATITQPQVISNVSASTVTNVGCFGGNNGSVTVTTPTGGTPPYTYSWSTTPVQSTKTALNLIAGTYTVTVTDSKGCIATSSATVTQPAQPLSNVAAQTTQNVKCKGSSTGIITVSNPTGGTPPYSYKWNTTPIQNTKTAVDVPFGSYTVTVTDSNGCIATSTTNVTEPAPITNVEAVVVRNVQCFGESNGSAKVTNPNGGTPPYSYSWNTNPIQTTQVASFLKAGEYVVTVTDMNGCLATSNVKITQPNIVPKPTIAGEVIVCSKNTISTFRVDSKSGYTISWSTPKNGRIIGTNSRDSVVIEWLNSGIDTVYARYTDAQTGCYEETKKAVLVGNSLTPSIQGSASTCIDTVPVTYRTRFQAGQSYGWSKPRLGTIIGAINLDSVQIEWNASGQDTLILREFTIATGCFKDTSLIITINPRPQPSISGKSELVEYAQSNVYSVSNESGSSYEWIILSGDAEITKKNGHIIELNVGDPGTVIVKVIQTTSDGCKNETQQEIVVKSITGVKEEMGKSFSVYPNPNNGKEELVVELPSTSVDEMRIELIDLLGIIRYEGMIPSQTVRHTIQLTDMPKGMYTIRLIMRDGVLSEKVIVE